MLRQTEDCLSPLAPLRLALGQRALLVQLVRRDILGRYRGSLLGLAWSFVTPLAMLAIYTFVFGTVFKARWNPEAPEGPLAFALALFAGLIVFNLFAEVASRAPGLITANPNYVKKTVFPLALLPISAVAAALFHAGMSLAILLATLALLGQLNEWALTLPLLWLPFLAFVLGLAWWLASLGVFVRDLNQVMGMTVTALLFLSPVFYPASALPEALRPWIFLNPLAFPIEATRQVLVQGQPPDWTALGGYALAALLFAWSGWAWFARTRKGFADVL